MKHIVVLGGSHAGLNIAHRLLKQAPKITEIKVTLVTPNSRMFWNIATTRAVVAGQFADEKLFEPIEPGFKQYTRGRFEFVVGTAQKLDVEAKSVVVVGGDGAEKTISYDILVLATGTSSPSDAPWKNLESYEATRDALHGVQSRIKAASTIVIGGAGSTGVETASELGFEYGTQKKITLVSNGPTVLKGTPASVSKAALKKLESFNVTVQLNTRVESATKTATGRTELILSNGEKQLVDVYLQTTGLVPNSAYVPPVYLNEAGFALVDQFLHLKGTTDIWAAGDLSSVQRPQYLHATKQSEHVVNNILLVLKGQPPAAFSAEGKLMLAVPLGRKAGTGHFGSFKMPSFMVHMIKGKTYFTQNLVPATNGALYK